MVQSNPSRDLQGEAGRLRHRPLILAGAASHGNPCTPPPHLSADKRYQRHDKRDKLPSWITQHLKDAHLNLSTDMLLCIAREFMRSMAQPYDRAAVGRSLLSEATVNALDSARPPVDPMET